MYKLLVVANTPSPNCEKCFAAVVRGASGSDNVEVIARESPLQADADDVIASDAIIIGTTENFGYMSGLVKDFFERIYYPCLEKTQARPCALYIKAGKDGTGTERAVSAIISGLRWRFIMPPMILRGDFSESFLSDCETMGETVAESLNMGLI